MVRMSDVPIVGRWSAATRYRAGVLLAATLPAVVVVAGCGSALAPGAAPTPPLLHVGQSAARLAAVAFAPGASDYVLTGQLPAEPTIGETYRWGKEAATVQDVSKVAATFQIGATPVRAAHGWKAIGPTGEVLMRDDDGHHWVYLRHDQLACQPVYLDVDATSPDSAVGCAISGLPVPAPGTPVTGTPAAGSVPKTTTSEAALATAAPILAALSISGTPHATSGSPAQVDVAPTFDGLQVSGLTTTISVDSLGIASASGRLLAPSKADTYPLITARTAFDQLRAQPVPEIALACPLGNPTQPVTCPTPTPTKITGATYGLMVSVDGTEPILAPAWLLTTGSLEQPIAMIAVDPKYLANSIGDGIGSGGTGGGSAQPGSPGAVPGNTADPASPPDSPIPLPPVVEPTPGGGSVGARHAAGIEVAVPQAGADELALVAVRGSCDSLPEARVVSDGPDKLVVAVTVAGPAAGSVCDARALLFTATVRLNRPLNDRIVVDASTGKPVKVDPTYPLPKS